MSHSLLGHFCMLARYNRPANERLYDACAARDDAEQLAVRPGFFRGIHGTLNHIIVGDRLWLTHFQGGVASSTGLDAILCEDFAELRAGRVAEDTRIEAFTASLRKAMLGGTIRYRNNEGRDLADPVDVLIAHFFTHQTHHRAQGTICSRKPRWCRCCSTFIACSGRDICGPQFCNRAAT